MASQSGVNSADSYVGSFISLISKYEIRYEGVLYHLNANDATIGLKNVRSYGTEGRKKDGPQIPPTDKVYEYILFRGSDIKDLQVKSPPSAKTEEQIHTDPAIIQSRYVSTPQSAIVGSSNSASPQWHDTPALFSRVYPGALPSYQSVTQAGQSEHSPPIQNVNSLSPSTPLNSKQYNRTSIGVSNFPQDHITVHPSATLSHNLTMQQKIQAPVTMGLDNASECINSALASSSTTVHPKLSPSLTPVLYTSSPDFPPSVSEQASLPSQSLPLTVNMLTMSSLPSYYQDSNLNEANVVGKTGSDPKQVIPFKSGPYSASSFSGTNLGPLFTPSPLSTPNQIGQSGQQMHSVTQKLDHVPKYMGVLTATSSSLISSPVDQAPLLPLPTSAQKSAYSTVNFTEEFDFEAMNEKFKKEEVWGSLGNSKQIDRAEGAEDYEAGHSLDDTEVHDHVPNPKPAYDKDDFFDTISCNSLNRQTRNLQNRFSERMRQDTETFGIQYRPTIGYGGFGGGRGGNFRGSYYRGRGYDRGGRRGHGGMYF